VVNVTERHIPEKILCSATAYPEATYQWKHDTGTFGINNALILSSVSRDEGGNYTCEAFNRHGKITQNTFINVLCTYMVLHFKNYLHAFEYNFKHFSFLIRLVMNCHEHSSDTF
jgi:hypothetical protein